MLRESIVSVHNPLVKRFRAVREGRGPGFIFVEGVRLCTEAVQADVRVESVIYTSTLSESQEAQKLLKAFDKLQCRGAIVTDKLMKFVCDTVTPQGVALLARAPRWELDDLFTKQPGLLLILDRLQDPGNLGTILRSAEAAGASGIVLTAGSVRSTNTKAVRASMGSLFRIPVLETRDLSEIAAKLNEHGFRVFSALPSEGAEYTREDYRGATAFIIGSEATGIDPQTSTLASGTVNVPMASTVQSINAAIAAAVLLFETARQRRAAAKPSHAAPPSPPSAGR